MKREWRRDNQMLLFFFFVLSFLECQRWRSSLESTKHSTLIFKKGNWAIEKLSDSPKLNVNQVLNLKMLHCQGRFKVYLCILSLCVGLGESHAIRRKIVQDVSGCLHYFSSIQHNIWCLVDWLLYVKYAKGEGQGRNLLIN